MAKNARKRVGLIGCGTIGGHIARRIREGDLAEIAFVCDVDEKRARDVAPGAKYIADLGDAAGPEVDLVIEAANAEVVRRVALDILARRNFLPFTLTALADEAFQAAVQKRCREAGTRMLIPHGALLGIDGVYDGRAVIREVTIRTVKNPKNLGLDAAQVGVIYDGPTREACRRFPRNVNVHATLALMGVGFDRQRSVIIADPDTKQMRHEISIKGDGLEWNLTIASMALGGVTGSYTPESAASTVARVLSGDYGIVVA